MFFDGLTNLCQLTLSGLAVGSIYAVVALGFVILFKATDIFNFAQGELMTLGAFMGYFFIVQLHIPIIWAFLLTFVATAFIGLAVEELFFRPMVGEPIFSVIMVTVGLSTFLKGLIGLSWGSFYKRFPPFVSEDPIQLAGLVISPGHIVTIVVTGILIVIFAVFFKFSSMGIGMRAVANDQDAALLSGISVRKIFGAAWIISGVVAGIGGILLSNITYLHPTLSGVGIKVFPAVVLGGLDSITGAIVGGLIIGILENIAGGYLGGDIKEITSFVILIAILMIKPYGLFGKEEIERV
ncbi:MAG TPA: branched-chain amino acid ABC transporter permease [Desulfobacteraceae bacterium]|nr:branched-chain amino acid ABC transporter permease [Desulfobacteraceae bacterium]HPJ67167.1 branched-chain amino acid ABC transporter permease [Desulfobacteraceae bacterium]HPQ29327.1 branched-chain amino acid ABC transporter permease [Desulfobacteraceae bacterium]